MCIHRILTVEKVYITRHWDRDEYYVIIKYYKGVIYMYRFLLLSLLFFFLFLLFIHLKNIYYHFSFIENCISTTYLSHYLQYTISYEHQPLQIF